MSNDENEGGNGEKKYYPFQQLQGDNCEGCNEMGSMILQYVPLSIFAMKIMLVRNRGFGVRVKGVRMIF